MKEEKIPTIGLLKGNKMIDSKYILALTNNQLEDKDKKYNKKLSEIGKIIKLSKEDFQYSCFLLIKF